MSGAQTPKPKTEDDIEAPQTAGLAPGAVVTAVFPRMMGKRRPGLVLAVFPTQGPLATVVAAPLTSSHKGRGLRLAMTATRLDRATQGWLLPHMASALPPGMASTPIAQASPEDLESALQAVESLFGAKWRGSNPPLSAPTRRPRLLRREKRRRGVS
ncbi:MAG: type II toxin-antitoxin system PemK/MazF family toxin [Rhodobacteraceae bacterium]|nr:type II toxin-antitoxin system PemK/MazF family toxin [Paracoccaceae bacterium]